MRKNDPGAVYFSLLPLEDTVAPLMCLCLQELQFALRQMACTLAEQQPPEMKDQDCPAGGAADPQSQGHDTTHRPEVTAESQLLHLLLSIHSSAAHFTPFFVIKLFIDFPLIFPLCHFTFLDI